VQPVDYARLAQRAYADAPTVGQSVSASRMHAYAIPDTTDVVHVFRGTDDFQSLLADGDITTTYVEGLGHVHAGFYRALAVILPACLALPRPAAVAGHSLGAAMAILYAGVLALVSGPDVAPVPVYAFEPPRVSADDTLSKLLIAKAVPWFACRNGRDIIPQIPPTLAHAGPVTAIGTAVLPFDNIEDHQIARVVAALAGAVV